MSSRYFGLIPAAGSGQRFAAGEDPASAPLPKQYRPLRAGADAAPQPMLWHAVRGLLAAKEIEIVFVVLAPGDETFRTLDRSAFGNRIEPLYCGGASRRDSVLNGLVAIADIVDPDDWVLVHDAARPCLGRTELRRLIDTVGTDDTHDGPGADGGILAIPVADTLKRGDADARIVATEPRAGLWQAQTPQMFRHGPLRQALLQDPQATDEASAVERLGMAPRLVIGSAMNIKVTLSEDCALAEAILNRAEPGGTTCA